MNKYQDLRAEVRAFCPDAIWEKCKGKEQLDSFERINHRMDEYYQNNPDLGAIPLRRKYYQIASEEIAPKLFLNSPFYFALGINGGWFPNPSAWMNDNLQGKVLKKNVPPEAIQHFIKRRAERFVVCCGPFVDSAHHLLPYTRMIKGGISGIYADVQKELQKGDLTSDERFFLETAADGLFNPFLN